MSDGEGVWSWLGIDAAVLDVMSDGGELAGEKGVGQSVNIVAPPRLLPSERWMKVS